VRENAWNNFMAAGRTACRNHIALRIQYPLVRHPLAPTPMDIGNAVF
jgi:hypothetical protein